MLNNENIREYQRIYREIFQKEITREEAYEQGIKLVTLLETIFKSH